MSGRKKKGRILERSALLLAGQTLRGVSNTLGLNGGQLDGLATKMLLGTAPAAKAIEAGDSTPEGMNDPDLVLLKDLDLDADQPEGNEWLVVRVTGAEEKQDEFGKLFNVFFIKCRYGSTAWSLKKRFSQLHRFDLDLRASVGSDLGNELPAFPKQGFFGAPQVEQRRRQLDLYVVSLTRLIAKGPSVGPVDDAAEEARNIAVMHVTQALYAFIEMSGQMFEDAKVRREEFPEGHDDPVRPPPAAARAAAPAAPAARPPRPRRARRARRARPARAERAARAVAREQLLVGCEDSLPPPPTSRTDWTRLVPPPVLAGHVSSLLTY